MEGYSVLFKGETVTIDNGFNVHGEYDYSMTFLRRQREFSHHAFDAFFRIELFKQYDLFISLIPEKQWIAVIRRD